MRDIQQKEQTSGQNILSAFLCQSSEVCCVIVRNGKKREEEEKKLALTAHCLSLV